MLVAILVFTIEKSKSLASLFFFLSNLYEYQLYFSTLNLRLITRILRPKISPVSKSEDFFAVTKFIVSWQLLRSLC